MTATTLGRWDRLAADLAAAGITARIDAKPYTETVYGRNSHGVSRSITLRHPDGGTVEINDTWWPKNPDVWTGWDVARTDRDSIVRGRPARSKKRSEIVTAVKASLRQSDSAGTAGR